MNIDVKDTALMKYLGSQSTLYCGKALELRDAVQGWLNYIPATFPHYTRHTIEHSEEIISQLSQLLFDEAAEAPVVKLSPIEAYVLIAAAYLHDAGMVAADSEKLTIIASDDEWKNWTSEGGGAERWRKIGEIRNSRNLTDEATHFVADLQTRFLLAEFIRSRHHLRASDVLRQYEPQFGRFGFGDKSLIRTIADVCVSHGLRHFELDDKERFPERRVIQGHAVNVRFMAILLRLGDLLDMSSDRACPLLMNAASPIPPDSWAHWTQYDRIIHRSTSPKRIEITAECENQDEHRVLVDWCQWIVDEVKNARELASYSEAPAQWQPPQASLEGNDATIKIRAAATASYIPSSWTFEMDKESVLELLAKDLYQNPLVFIRELIQNALDANRCQMYMDLRNEGLSEPEFPTAVAQSRRDRYPVFITLESRQIPNTLSGETEEKQFLIIEDSGVGMDREIIQRYFLQVGRSYYTTDEFRRRFRFAPTSRFGIGFLSVFAVSDCVKVETYKPTSPKPESVALTITGPRNYLLTERGARKANGTRIEVQLRERLTQEKLIESILGWCKRVEFRVVVQTGETKRTITAEKADDFVFERSDMTRENARLFVKSFPLNRPGLEGEIYIFGRTDENGESWASSFVKSDEDFHPIADERSVPKSIICLHGISMSDHIFEDGIFPEHIFGHRKASFRLDIRDKNFQPSLSRGWNYMLAEEHKDAVRDTLVQALREHLEVTKLNQKEDAWKYRNMLANEYEVMPLWESYGGMIPMYREGHFTTMSLAECRSHESLTSVHRMFKDRYDFVRPEDEDPTIAATDMQQSAVILGTDLLLLDGKILSALVDQRVPADIQYNENNVISIVWRSVGSAGSEGSGSRIFVDEKHRGYRFCIGTIVAGIKDDRHIAFFVSGRKYPMYWVRTLWNKDHPLTAWLTRVKNACDDGEHSLARPMSKVFSFINSYGSGHGGGMNLNNLNRYLRGWATLANLPDDLHPPEIEITEDMFVFLG